MTAVLVMLAYEMPWSTGGLRNIVEIIEKANEERSRSALPLPRRAPEAAQAPTCPRIPPRPLD